MDALHGPEAQYPSTPTLAPALPRFGRAVPVWVVDRMDEALRMWCQGLGFERIVEMPSAGGPAWVHLCLGQAELLCRSRASLDGVGDEAGRAWIQLEVSGLDEALRGLRRSGFAPVLRASAWGGREATVSDAEGNRVTLVEAPKASA